MYLDTKKHYYVSVGGTGAMFTLRYAMYESHAVGTIHIQNLSTDPEIAVAKAEEISRETGIPLQRTYLPDNLREIRRRSKEEIEEQQRKIERQKQERKEEFQRRKQERLDGYKNDLDNGIMPIGKHAGKSFSEIPRDYLEWMTDTEHDEDSPMHYAAQKVLEFIMNDPLPVPDPESVTGKVKGRYTFNVTCIAARSFERPAFGFRNGEPVFVTTMVDDEGHCLVCFSTTFKMEVKEQQKIKATVKEHSIYKGQAQTVVQRVKVLE